MTEQPEQQTNKPPVGWQTQAYLVGTVLGTVFGVVSAYLYNRAADEYAERNGGKPPRPGTLELLGLFAAILAAVRQITELGKPPKK